MMAESYSDRIVRMAAESIRHATETRETSTRYSTSYVVRCACGWRRVAEYRIQADRAGARHVARATTGRDS